MKIGLSYSRCVRDIVDGTVDIRDVLVLITRTDFDPRIDEQWTSIWQGYGGGQNLGGGWSTPEWDGYTDEARFREASLGFIHHAVAKSGWKLCCRIQN